MASKLGRRGFSALAAAALCTAFMLGVVVSVPARDVYGQGKTDALSQALIDLYSKINPSVVSISVRIPQDASSSALPCALDSNGTPTPYCAGEASGFVYSSDGYIVTNSHVVQDTDRVEVTFADETTVLAKIIGFDRDSDLAVIKVETDKSRLIPIKLADSDLVQIGQRVLAIGNPFGYNNSMSQGIVSGLNRRLDSQASSGDTSYQIPGMIQTDAAINPGNSGGPLFNTEGEVLGVNTLIESRVRQSSGVGFAVPSNLVKKFADLIIKNGKVQHSYLGIQGGDLSFDENVLLGIEPGQQGVLIQTVSPGSPAEKAGLHAGTIEKKLDGIPFKVGGDIIVAVDKTPIRHFSDLLTYLFVKTDVGQQITVTVLRDGKPLDLVVTLEARAYS